MFYLHELATTMGGAVARIKQIPFSLEDSTRHTVDDHHPIRISLRLRGGSYFLSLAWFRSRRSSDPSLSLHSLTAVSRQRRLAQKFDARLISIAGI